MGPNDKPTIQPVHSSLDELDRRARRAEHSMNRALEQRRWDMVRCHRGDMLAAEAELRRQWHAAR